MSAASHPSVAAILALMAMSGAGGIVLAAMALVFAVRWIVRQLVVYEPRDCPPGAPSSKPDGANP